MTEFLDDDDLAPIPLSKPAAPLPRLFKSPPPPDSEPELKVKPAKEKKEDPEAKPKPAAKKKRKKSSEGEDEGKLVGATPTLETYEGRKYARIAIGGGVLAVVVVGILLFSRMFNGPAAQPNGPLANSQSPLDRPVVKKVDKARLELEARTMYEHAREVAKAGNIDEAIALLEEIQASYAGTDAAKDAIASISRRKKGHPLFIAGSIVSAEEVVESPAPPPVEKEADEKIDDGPPRIPIETAKANPIRMPGTLKSASVKIVTPPPNAEPHRKTGIGLPTAEVAPRRLPAGFFARIELGVHASGWPVEIISVRDGAVMVLIPGGTFPMGRDDGPKEESPKHMVTLVPYYIDQHEVTVGQYKRLLASGVLRLDPDSGGPTDLDSLDPSMPMVNVSYEQALAYAKAVGKWLPTEAQWEFAARTTDGRAHPWGDSPATWNRPRVPRQIDPVMSFDNDLSPYSVFDMAGNAWEWTSDYFTSSWYERLRGKNTLDPAGPRSTRERLRAVRGSSRTWHATARVGFKEESRAPYLGFRCVLPVAAIGSSATPATAPGVVAQPQPGQLPPAPGTPPPNPGQTNQGLTRPGENAQPF